MSAIVFRRYLKPTRGGGPSPEMKVTLREVAFMKLFCDSYFLGKFVKPMVAASKTGAIAPE